MSALATADVRDLLAGLADTCELVLRHADGDPLLEAWRAAAAEARDAYAGWCAAPGAARHAAYAAAEDRADAALAAFGAAGALVTQPHAPRPLAA